MTTDALRRLQALRGLTRPRSAAAARALRGAVERHAITIPDVLGYKVRAVAVEDLLDLADALEAGDDRG